MFKEPVQVVVLAAGRGVRMRSDLPKVMHAVAGRPMVRHVIEAAHSLKPTQIIVVIGANQASVAAAVAPALTVVQDPPLGTGDAVRVAQSRLAGGKGTVLVLFGDTPLVRPATLAALVQAREAGAAVVVQGFRPADPGSYGRLICASNGELQRIVEAKDANEAERAIGLCNGGAMALAMDELSSLLAKLDRRNAQGEFYLTDVVAHARAAGLSARVVEAEPDEVQGVNSRTDLAAVEAAMQRRLRRAAMDGGATLIDPESIFFSADTRLGRDVTIGPHVVFGPGVVVADGVTIRPFCHLEGAQIASGAIIGPYARLRPGARIGEEVHIGNFVEVKNTTVDKGAKANHLTYLGDAHVGAGANVGAGTITCNYDGFDKYRTEIGAGAFIGSNSALVAPVTIGDGAYVGSGSVVTDDVPADALALGRGRQVVRAGWARAFRMRKSQAKSGAEPATRAKAPKE